MAKRRLVNGIGYVWPDKLDTGSLHLELDLGVSGRVYFRTDRHLDCVSFFWWYCTFIENPGLLALRGRGLPHPADDSMDVAHERNDRFGARRYICFYFLVVRRDKT